MSKVVVILVLLVSCDSPNRGEKIDAAQPVDSMIFQDAEITDTTIDAKIFDAQAPIDSIDTSATCISHVSFFQRNASVMTIVACQVPQTVSITTTIFSGDVLEDSIRQGGLGCGSSASRNITSTTGFPDRAAIFLHVEGTEIFKECVQD